MARPDLTIDVTLTPTEIRDAQLDHLIWLIERYGYARREGKHQGYTSAAWMKMVRHGIAYYELRCMETLEGQWARIYERIAALEAAFTPTVRRRHEDARRSGG